jgi:hypothetical protein
MARTVTCVCRMVGSGCQQADMICVVATHTDWKETMNFENGVGGGTLPRCTRSHVCITCWSSGGHAAGIAGHMAGWVKMSCIRRTGLRTAICPCGGCRVMVCKTVGGRPASSHKTPKSVRTQTKEKNNQWALACTYMLDREKTHCNNHDSQPQEQKQPSPHHHNPCTSQISMPKENRSAATVGAAPLKTSGADHSGTSACVTVCTRVSNRP